MAILFLDFFGSDPSKMDQTCKFGKQASQILEFKPKGLDFYKRIILTSNSFFKKSYELGMYFSCFGRGVGAEFGINKFILITF